MNAEVGYSGNRERKGYGRNPVVNINLIPENDLEKAIMRMAYSGKRKVMIWNEGTATIQITMPRGSND